MESNEEEYLDPKTDASETKDDEPNASYERLDELKHAQQIDDELIVDKEKEI